MGERGGGGARGVGGGAGGEGSDDIMIRLNPSIDVEGLNVGWGGARWADGEGGGGGVWEGEAAERRQGGMREWRWGSPVGGPPFLAR